MSNSCMTYAGEQRDDFLAEARSKSYMSYDARVLQAKNRLAATRTFKRHALLALERFGA